MRTLAAVRRVHGLTGPGDEYVSRNNCKKKRRRGPCQVHRRLSPSIASIPLRGNTLSVHAHADGNTPPHRHQSEGVNAPRQGIDPSRVAALGAINPALTDRETRVYMLVTLAFPDAEVDVPTLANLLPLTEQQVGQALGDLVNHGLLTRRQKVTGYNDNGGRIRRYFYRLAVGA